jgi:hypothetical protein
MSMMRAVFPPGKPRTHSRFGKIQMRVNPRAECDPHALGGAGRASLQDGQICQD